MRAKLIASGLVLTLLGGCATISESRFNPLNWFGSSEPTPVATAADGSAVIVLPTLSPRKGYPELIDTRPLAPQITDVQVVRSASGAIVTATALVPSLGYYDAQLVRAESDSASTLVFDYRLRPPQKTVGTGNAAQRRIPAAYSLSTPELAGIRTIIVRGANGARQVRR